MATEKQEGPQFLMSLGMQLGEMRANLDALLGRIENIEARLDGGAPIEPHQAQGQQLAQPAAQPQKVSTPLDTFAHFTGETGKLMQGIADLKNMVTTYGPMLAQMKASLTPATPAPVTVPGVVVPQPASVFEPVAAPAPHAPGHA